MELPAGERIASTRSALADGVLLLGRWKELDPAVSADWSPRAAQAASMLAYANSIADLGCGHMLLKRYLRPTQIYVPVDLVIRDEYTIVCDFNRDRLPALAADYFVALGLLEYIYSIDSFVRALRSVFVGGVASLFASSGSTELNRVRNGLVNHHTIEEIRSMFVAPGFTLRDERQWEDNHYLFLLK